MELPSQHQSIDDDVLEGRFAKQRCGEHQQGVEPTSRHHKVRVTRALTHSRHSLLVLGWKTSPLLIKAMFVLSAVWTQYLIDRHFSIWSIHPSIHALVLSVPPITFQTRTPCDLISSIQLTILSSGQCLRRWSPPGRCPQTPFCSQKGSGPGRRACCRSQTSSQRPPWPSAARPYRTATGWSGCQCWTEKMWTGEGKRGSLLKQMTDNSTDNLNSLVLCFIIFMRSF